MTKRGGGNRKSPKFHQELIRISGIRGGVVLPNPKGVYQKGTGKLTGWGLDKKTVYLLIPCLVFYAMQGKIITIYLQTG